MRIVPVLLTFAMAGAAAGQAPPGRTIPFTGRVADVLGEPIPAAAIEVVVAGRCVARATTDGEGIYHVPTTTGGDLRVSAPGKATLVLAWRGGTTARRRNVQLPDGARIHGQVFDRWEQPVADAPVVVVHGHESRHTRSDADGHYAFDGIALGTVTVRAWSAGLRGFVERTLGIPSDVRLDLTLPEGGATLRSVRVHGLPPDAAGAVVQITNDELALLPDAGCVPLGIDGTAVVAVDTLSLVTPRLAGFTFEPNGRFCVSGGAALEFVAKREDRVLTTLRGTLRSTQNRPLAHRELVLRDLFESNLASAWTDEYGKFHATLELPPNRIVRFGLALDGFQLLGDEPLLREGFAWSGMHDPVREIVLRAEPLARLAGDVRDTDGTLLSLADVVVADPEAPHRELVHQLTDRAGRCALSLPDGDYELLASSHDGRVLTANVRVRRRGDEPEAIRWHRVPTGSVRGRLCDRTGAPLAGTTMQLWHEDSRDREKLHAARRIHVTVLTDRNGRFRAHGLQAGSWFAAPERTPGCDAAPFDVQLATETRLEIRAK